MVEWTMEFYKKGLKACSIGLAIQFYWVAICLLTLLPSSELVGIKGHMHSISFNRHIVYVETLLRSDRVKKDKRS